MLQTEYATLQEDAEVQAALKTVGGTLAKAPDVVEAAQDTPEQTVSLRADDTNAPQEAVASAEQPPSAEEGVAPDDDAAPEKPVAKYASLKEQLTTLDKETKLALGTFNKSAKEYLKQKKDLVKRIKKGEGMIAKRSKYQDSLPDGEQKTKFGLETESKYVKPLNGLKAKLGNLAKPVATTIEKNLKEAKQLFEQIQGLPEYAANPKSIDSLAEKIAKYRKGYEVQQTKMAK